jgi:myo-inositol-1(or 4)-monophosphatase
MLLWHQEAGQCVMNLTETNAALSAAIKAARLGREVLLNYLGRLERVEEKFQQGLVSEADKESEKVIFDYLRKNFPSDLFLGEESTADVHNIQQVKGRRWVVDPLDGTTNYIHRFPVFCISISLEIDGEPQVGVIDVPLLGEVYTATKGGGARVNGQILKVSQSQQLKDTLLATGFFGDNEPVLKEQLKIFSQVVRKCRGIRRAGAAAYDLCMVARGVFDAYWEKGLKPWDSSAGVLLVREAGGVVSSYRGETYSPYHKTLLAGNPAVHKLLKKEFENLIEQDSD